MPATATILDNDLASESFDAMLATETFPFQPLLTDSALAA